MPEQYGSTDPALMSYTAAIDDLFQQFQQTPSTEWGQILMRLDEIRDGIEQRIDAWMTLDEQIDELLEATVLEDVDSIDNGASPSPAVSDLLTTPPQQRLLDSQEETFSWNNIEDEDHVMGSLRKAIGFYDLWLFEEASSLFSEILQSQPDNLLASLFYAAAETAQGRFADIIPQLEDIHQSHHIKFRAAAAEIAAAGYFQQGNVQEAVNSLLQVVGLQPDNEDAWFNIGFCYIRLQDWTAAAGALSQVLDINKEDTAAQELLIDIWNRLGEYDAALHLSGEALSQKPGHSGFLRRRARTLQLTGYLPESLRMYEQVVLQNPHQASVYDEYATACMQAGNLDRAAAVLQKSLCLVPDRTQHKEKLAVVLLLQHRPDKAYEVLQSINQSTETTFIHTIALAQYEWQRGQKEKALVLLERVLHQPDSEFRQLAGYYYKQWLDETKHDMKSIKTIQKLNIP